MTPPKELKNISIKSSVLAATAFQQAFLPLNKILLSIYNNNVEFNSLTLITYLFLVELPNVSIL